MDVQKSLIAIVLVVLSLTGGLMAYTAVAGASAGSTPGAPSPAQAGGKNKPALVENIRFDGAVLMGAYKGRMPAVLYTLIAYGREHTTTLAYFFAFRGIAETRNKTVVAFASAKNATWVHSDFRVIRRQGRPIGLAMGFKISGPIYVNYTDPSYGQSGYYDINITVALMAFYHPRLGTTVMATYGEGGLQNRSLVAYDVHGRVVLAAAFRISGWPTEAEGGHLLVGFTILLRAKAWLHTEEGFRTPVKVAWVSPFCASTRPRLQMRPGLIRGTFAFAGKALVWDEEGRQAVRTACLYQARGWLLKLSIVVPKEDIVLYPALRR